MKKNFLWGSASAAYQIEGAANLDGKLDSIWDTYSKIPGNTFKDTTGEVAIDFYHLYEEDIKLMAEMGLEAYRFSISWPRVIPTGNGEVNQKGIQFYHNIIDMLLKYDIEPIVTIYHWDLPQALQDEYAGWESRKIINDFTNYSKLLFKEYGKKVKYWVTLNEQNIFIPFGYLQKLHPPKISDFQRFLNADHNANMANAATINLFKDMELTGQIGPSFAYTPAYASTDNPLDILAMENAEELTNWFWMDVYTKGEYPPIAKRLIEKNGYNIPLEDGDKEVLKAAKPDFMGVNYYKTTSVVSPESKIEEMGQSKLTVAREVKDTLYDNFFKNVKNPHANYTPWNWIIDPVGLNVAMRRITSRYNLPILITENGLGAFDELTSEGKVHDEYRIDYLQKHIDAIQEANDSGCEIIGYCTWSMQDLFSWTNGYKKRYGFVYIDRDELDEKELKRYKKDSFYWYKKLIKEQKEK